MAQPNPFAKFLKKKKHGSDQEGPSGKNDEEARSNPFRKSGKKPDENAMLTPEEGTAEEEALEPIAVEDSEDAVGQGDREDIEEGDPAPIGDSDNPDHTGIEDKGEVEPDGEKDSPEEDAKESPEEQAKEESEAEKLAKKKGKKPKGMFSIFGYGR